MAAEVISSAIWCRYTALVTVEFTCPTASAIFSISTPGIRQHRYERVPLLAGRPVVPYARPAAQLVEVAPDILRPLRRTGPVAEHDGQAAHVICRAELQPRGGLLLPQREQDCYDLPGHPDRALGPLGLQVLQDELPLAGHRIRKRLEAFSYTHHAGLEIHVFPAQAEQLAWPQTAHQRACEICPPPGGELESEECADLIQIHRPGLSARTSRDLGQGGDIPGSLSVPLGAPDREPQRRPEPPHHVGRQSLGRGILKEPLDLRDTMPRR